MQKLPETGFLKLKQIIGDPKANPPSPPLVPVSRSKWLRGVKDGVFPAPVYIGRTPVWDVDELKQCIAELKARKRSSAIKSSQIEK